MNKPETQSGGSLARLVGRALRRWERASSAYMVDCNTRLINKPDTKRERLRLENRIAFNRLTDALNGRTRKKI